MGQNVEISRVTIIADAALEKTLVQEVLRLGAKGYTCMQCFGKGRHETVVDPLSGQSRVRIEVLTRPAVAAAILDYVHQGRFENYPVAAFSDTVQADGRDTFY